MSLSKKNQLQEKKGKKIWEIEKSHPYKTLFFLGSMAFTLIILFLLFSFWFFDHHFETHPKLLFPKGLTLSILILMAIAFAASKGNPLIEKENYRGLSSIFRIILFLASLYLVISLGAWRIFLGGLDTVKVYPGKAFLFLIATMHFLQFIVGMGMALFGYFKLSKNSQDPVKILVYFTNKYELTSLEISFLGWYWITGTGLMIFLFMFYMLN
jgi:cytochrome c oxidase subunit III